jgi:hypothetical protein
MRRLDSPAIPQLAVPVAVPIEMAREGYATSSTRAQATGDLGLIAFFYLLRVGEYTAPRVVVKNGRIVHATRTKQFRVMDVGFFKDGKLLHKKSPLAKLLEADSATLKISNQKNGRMGQTIHHKTSEGFNSCVRALARRIHHILTNGGNKHSLISTYHDGDKLNTVTPDDIRRSIRRSIKTLKLHEAGLDPDLVGTHSLRAGGAMALKLNKEDDSVIMKYGRWSSNTFLMYIHNQIGHLAEGISTKMSTPVPFLNIASITH